MELAPQENNKYTARGKLWMILLSAMLLFALVSLKDFTGAAVYGPNRIVDATIRFPQMKIPLSAKVVIEDVSFKEGIYEKDAAAIISKKPEEIMLDGYKVFGWDTKLEFFLSSFNIKLARYGTHKLNISVAYPFRNQLKTLNSMEVDITINEAKKDNAIEKKNETYAVDQNGVFIDLYKDDQANIEQQDETIVTVFYAESGEHLAAFSVQGRYVFFDKEGETKEVDYNDDKAADYMMQLTKAFFHRNLFLLRPPEIIYTPPPAETEKAEIIPPPSTLEYEPRPYVLPQQNVEDIRMENRQLPPDEIGFVPKRPAQPEEPAYKKIIDGLSEKAGGKTNLIYIIIAVFAVLIAIPVLKHKILPKPKIIQTAQKLADVRNEILALRSSGKRFNDIRKQLHADNSIILIDKAIEEVRVGELADEISLFRQKGKNDAEIRVLLAKEKNDKKLVIRAFEKADRFF